MGRISLKVLTVVAILSLINGNRLCSTPACKEIAAIFKNSINPSVNPCNDFYQYACGNWMVNHKIPDYKSQTGVTDETADREMLQMKELLEGFNLKSDASKSASSVTYSAHLYQNCVQLGSQPASVALAHLQDVITAVFGPNGWNIGQKAQSDHVALNWYEAFTKIFAIGGIRSVFQIQVLPDPKNVTSYMLKLLPSDLGLGDKDLSDLKKNPSLIKAYRTFIKKSAKLLDDGKCDNELLESEIEEIIQLESALAKVKMPQEDRRNPSKTYNKLTFEQLAARTQFDWLNKILLPILKSLGSKAHIDASTQVIVTDPNFYVKAVSILSKASPRTVENFFGWKVVAEYNRYSSNSFRDLIFEFNKVIGGITKQPERWRTCLNMVDAHLNLGLSRLFVDRLFTSREKTEAFTVVDQVQHSFSELIQSNQWLDPDTKKASLRKHETVRKNIGYPEWLLNNTELDKVTALDDSDFTTDVLAEANYILGYVRFRTNRLRKEFNDLFTLVEVDKNWPMGPFIVNAAYEPEQNSITIPAGQLKSPFFSAEYPSAINYGSIGSIVGHEFTHGLDDEGSQYDEKGNLHNWWSKEAIERFRNGSKCFVNQYSAYKETVTGLNLNGANTLGENIADNGGLRQAFHAFRAHQSKRGPSPRLADLPQLTPEQLFFVSYSLSWCTSMRPEAMRNKIEYNVHAPAMYRVNVPVANSEDFAKVFQCPAGSAMNPAKKCALW